MDYNTLLDLAADLGYELAMSGAETFRIEESICRMLGSYGIPCEVFAIPNCLIVSIETPEGTPMTRMRRIGYHGNDLNSVERFSGLSRAICNRKPDPKEGRQWFTMVKNSCRSYSVPLQLLGSCIGAGGFCFFYGGTLAESLFSGLCGLLVGLVNYFTDKLRTNQFFRTITASFLMALLAYGICSVHPAVCADAMIIGALMLLVPGLLFTNAMRDIIYGDTNSGVNRIVQVLLIAAALALGTAVAWNVASSLWGTPTEVPMLPHHIVFQCLSCLIGCIGFSILFNIHGPDMLLCALGGVLAWLVYSATVFLGGNDIAASFWAALLSSAYSEIMARLRKRPAIAYLVVSIFPLIPGAGVYYTMNYAVRGNMDMFAQKGMHTAAVAGIIAVGILLASTSVRLWNNWKHAGK